jgi:two-component system chemotaxis response regulator CheB
MDFYDAHRDVIVVGASAGGVEALRTLVGGFPPDLPAAVFVVLHLPRYGPSALPAILTRAGPLPATHATEGMVPLHSHIYIAPADHHMLLRDRRIRLSRGPTENGHRPAIDPLFRSAARNYGDGVIGVVLSGSRDDGAAGLLAVVDHGGLAVVQDPEDAVHPSMPRSALELVSNAAVRPVAKIGAFLGELSREPYKTTLAGGRTRSNALSDAEVDMADMVPVSTADLPIEPAGFGCPTCGGSLFEVAGSPVPRYRCRVGHGWSPESLLEEQANALESALWMALRALEEKSALSRRMARTRESLGNTALASRYDAAADESHRAGLLIRDLIASIGEGRADVGEAEETFG